MGLQITMRSAKLASIESRQQLIIYNFNADKRGENSPIAGLEDLLFNVFFFFFAKVKLLAEKRFSSRIYSSYFIRGLCMNNARRNTGRNAFITGLASNCWGHHTKIYCSREFA